MTQQDELKVAQAKLIILYQESLVTQLRSVTTDIELIGKALNNSTEVFAALIPGIGSYVLPELERRITAKLAEMAEMEEL